MDSAPCRTWPGNCDKHPANILFETGVVQKRHTREEKAADDKHIMEAKAAQQGVQRLALMEMEVEAKASEAKLKKAKPPPHPHPCIQAPASKSKGLSGGGKAEGVESARDSSYRVDSVSNMLLS